MLSSWWKWNRNKEQAENAERQKSSFPKERAENADLPKPVLNKIINTHKQYVKYNFVASLIFMKLI